MYFMTKGAGIVRSSLLKCVAALSLTLLPCTLGVAFTLTPAHAQTATGNTQTVHDPADSFYGNVRARDMTSLSFTMRGCIAEVSEDAKRDRAVSQGQVVVKLDDLRMQLALRTADVRVAELSAAVEERQLSLQAAIADDRRRQQDLALVDEEFQRNSVLMGRGLINESTMDSIERQFMEATFASERTKEAIATANAAVKRAEIALEIGRLDRQSAEIDLTNSAVTAPFDGILLGFDVTVGDCVQDGQIAARLYVPDQKSVDVFFRISRLTNDADAVLSVGAPVKVIRANGQSCGGAITHIDTEANLESQFVGATVDIEESCATDLFLNEAVRVETLDASN